MPIDEAGKIMTMDAEVAVLQDIPNMERSTGIKTQTFPSDRNTSAGLVSHIKESDGD